MSQSPNTLGPKVVFLVVLLAATTKARPSHFADNQLLPSDADTTNLLETTNFKPWHLEMLAQRLSEMNLPTSQQMNNINNNNNNNIDDYGWERALRERGIRSPESKRQSRYRQCYFNPISCFKK